MFVSGPASLGWFDVVFRLLCCSVKRSHIRVFITTASAGGHG